MIVKAQICIVFPVNTMKRFQKLFIAVVSFLAAIVFVTPGKAQFYPAESPAATISQKVGFDEISITYARPRVRERHIWGELVPYDSVWRTGADYPTQVTFPSDVEIEGQPLRAGKYAFYTIPGPDSWTIIFSRNTKLWGAFGYKTIDDALRVTVVPRTSREWTESFTLEFADVTYNTTTLQLRWANLIVPIAIRIPIHHTLMRKIERRIAAKEKLTWGFYWRAANYLLQEERELDTAQLWIEESLSIERNWMNVWTFAELLAARRKFADAVRVGEDALAICRDQSPYCPYAQVYDRKMSEWRDQTQSGAENKQGQ